MAVNDKPDWETLHHQAADRMAQVDAMPADVRVLIHEFNVNAVVAAYRAGKTTPDEIRPYLTAQARNALPVV